MIWLNKWLTLSQQRTLGELCAHYDRRPEVMDRVVDGVLDDLDDSEDQERLWDNANGLG